MVLQLQGDQMQMCLMISLWVTTKHNQPQNYTIFMFRKKLMYKILLFTELFQILENGPNGD